MNLRHLALAGAAVLAVAALVETRAGAQTGPAPGVSPAPAGTATPAPRGRGKRSSSPAPSPEPSASETPPPPQFTSLDGVWEVQLQPLNGTPTVYSHFYMTQKGNDLSGTWVRPNSAKDAFNGTFDGRLFALTLKDGTHTMTLNGYVENFGDMVGLYKTDDPKDPGTPFTASHRKKERPT